MCAELIDSLENARRIIQGADGTLHINTAEFVLRRARALLDQPVAEGVLPLKERPTPQPVAVSERWPEFSDCDPQERVWVWNPVLDHWKLSRINRSYTHWLPANALPIPEATNG